MAYIIFVGSYQIATKRDVRLDSKTVLTAITAILLPLLFLFASCDRFSRPGTEERILVGALFPLTGEYADGGIRALNGAMLAALEINERGGVLGRKLDVVALDDMNDENLIVEQYGVLKGMGVAAVVGSVFSGGVIALAASDEDGGALVISPAAHQSPAMSGMGCAVIADFTQKYYDRFSHVPAYGSALSYAAMQILAAAFEEAGGTEADAVALSVRTGNVETVVGSVAFDKSDYPNRGSHIFRVEHEACPEAGDTGADEKAAAEEQGVPK